MLKKKDSSVKREGERERNYPIKLTLLRVEQIHAAKTGPTFTYVGFLNVLQSALKILDCP
jgi:hypothetical protein